MTKEELKALLEDMEIDLSYELIMALNNRQIDLKRAKGLAGFYVSKKPFTNKEDAFSALLEICKENRVACPVYLKHGGKAQSEEDRLKLRALRKQLMDKTFIQKKEGFIHE